MVSRVASFVSIYRSKIFDVAHSRYEDNYTTDVACVSDEAGEGLRESKVIEIYISILHFMRMRIRKQL